MTRQNIVGVTGAVLMIFSAIMLHQVWQLYDEGGDRLRHAIAILQQAEDRKVLLDAQEKEQSLIQEVQIRIVEELIRQGIDPNGAEIR